MDKKGGFYYMAFTKKEIDLFQDLGSLEFREQKIRELLDGIELLMSGRRIEVRSIVQTPSGEFSEKKAWKWIEELTECLQDYINKNSVYDYFIAGYLKEEELDKEIESLKLPEEEIKFYQSFLYLTIRALDFETDDMDLCLFSFCREVSMEKRNFCTMIKLAEAVEKIPYKNCYDMYLEELYGLPNGGVDGIIRLFDKMYNAIKGVYGISGYTYGSVLLEKNDLISMEERKKMEEVHAEEIQELHEFRESQEEAENEFVGIYDEDEESIAMQEKWDKMSEKEREMEERNQKMDWEQDEEYEENVDKITKWGKNFLYKDSFLNQYKIFRKYLFSDYKSTLYEYVKGMLNVYLLKEEQSLYVQDDEFMDIYTRFRKIGKLILRMNGGEE